MAKCDVVVVGAGLAGLSAARTLVCAGYELIVVEARDRVGGRTWSQTRPDGTVVDLGGQWVGPTQDRILALAEELGVETFPTYDQGETRRVIQGKSEVSPELLIEIFGKLQEMAETIPIEAPWTAKMAQEWDSQTFHTWLIANTNDRITLALARLVATAVFTSEPAELSLFHVLVYIRSAGSIGLLTSVPGGAQERRFVKGAQEISKRVAEELGARVRLNAPVRRLKQDGKSVIVSGDDYEITAKNAIVATPILLAERIIYSPPLPGYRSQLHQRLAPGATMKFHAIYKTPFWRAQGSNGRALADDGPVSVVFDNSPPSGAKGVLVGFVEGDEARKFWPLSADERRKAVLECFARHIGPEASDPLDFVEVNWSDEEWTRGCFGGNFPPGGWTRYGVVLRKPFGLVHWAGTETSPIWMNYMDGAVRSGERAASEVIAALKS